MIFFLVFQSFLSDTSQSTMATREPTATPPTLPSIGTISALSSMTTEPVNQIPKPPETETPVIEHEGDESTGDQRVTLPSVETTEPGEVASETEGGETQTSQNVTNEIQQVAERIAEMGVEESRVQDDAERSGGKESDAQASGEEGGAVRPADVGPLEIPEEEVTLLDPEQGGFYLTQVMVEVFNR